MLKKLALVFVILSTVAFAQNAKVRNHANATHHTIKAGAGLKKVGHVALKVAEVPGVVSFDALEAAVDTFGVAVQALADALDMGVAAPLEALPEPIEAIGDGVHVVYEAIDAAGQFLAK